MTNSGEGEGLLFYGNIIIPFKDRFDKNLKLYAYMTTKPEEVQKRKEEEEKAEAKAAMEEEAIRAFRRRTEVWQPAAAGGWGPRGSETGSISGEERYRTGSGGIR